MDNLIRFPSLTNPQETGYTVYANSTETSSDLTRRDGNALSSWAAAWPTYGDGIVQHGPDYPVQGEALGDFCASLATYLVDLPLHAQQEALELVAKNWPKDVSAEDIRFYRSATHKEGKTRYYSPRERKVSTSESKRHDKRWDAIHERMDGSVKAIVGLFYRHEYVAGGLLARLALYRQVKRVLEEQEGQDKAPYCNLATEKDLLGTDQRKNWTTLQAFDAVDELVRSYRLRASAERSLECWRSNQANRARRAEQAKDGATEVAQSQPRGTEKRLSVNLNLWNTNHGYPQPSNAFRPRLSDRPLPAGGSANPSSGSGPARMALAAIRGKSG